MAVPKHRTSKQKKRSRRSHLHLKPISTSICSNCGTTKNNHCVCKKCGFYKKEQILKPKTKKTKSEDKK